MQMISLTILAYLLQRLPILMGGLQLDLDCATDSAREFAFWMLPSAVVAHSRNRSGARAVSGDFGAVFGLGGQYCQSCARGGFPALATYHWYR